MDDVMSGEDSSEDDTLDVSIYDFPKKMWTVVPAWELGVKIGTFFPVIVLGVLGNVVLLNVILRNRSLRTPTNLLIANMAAADAAALSMCPIMFMYHDFYQNYQLGVFGCKMEGFLEGAFLITAVLNLCAVSYDRLTAIVLPMETRLNIRGAKIVMLCTWLVGSLLSIPLALYRTYKERQWKNFLEKYCAENTTILPIYWHVLIAVLVWLPLGIMIICYSAIFHKLDRYEKKVLKREHPMSVSYKTKVAKTLFIIVVSFVILRVPFTAVVFIRSNMLKKLSVNQILGSFEILWYTSHYLIFFNAALNPVIYGLSNDNFRRAYHQTPLLSCFYKPKIAKKTKNNVSFGKLFYGSIQPRGPCGEDRFAGIKSIFNTKDKMVTGFGSKVSRSTPMKQNNSRMIHSKMNYSECRPKFRYTDTESRATDTGIQSQGYI